MRIILIGASGHGKVCAEIAELSGRYDDILFLDDDRELKNCDKYVIVGIPEDFEKFVDCTTFFFVSIGNAEMRRCIQERVKAGGGRIATLVHPDSVISRNARIAAGTVVMAGAIVNPGTVIGEGVIVNTASSIDHDCEIRDYTHIAVGAHICGTVRIGGDTWIGAGVTVSNNLSICDGCVIGAGALVIHDITAPGTYVGVPIRQWFGEIRL